MEEVWPTYTLQAGVPNPCGGGSTLAAAAQGVCVCVGAMRWFFLHDLHLCTDNWICILEQLLVLLHQQVYDDGSSYGNNRIGIWTSPDLVMINWKRTFVIDICMYVCLSNRDHF